MPELLTEPDWTGLTEPDRLDYDEMRLDYPHPTGRGRHLHIARGGQHRGLILAGAAATDKTTAITQFGKPTRPSTGDVIRSD